MSPSGRRGSIALVAVLVVGAVAWWATRPPTSPSPDDAGVERGAIDETRPKLRGAEGTKEHKDAKPVENVPARTDDVAPDEARVQGRVRLPDGKAPKAGEVWLTIPDPEGRGPSRLLGHVPLASDGTYRISTTGLADAEPTRARIALVIDGFEALIRDVQLTAGRREVLDVEADEGMEVRVLVVDPDGKPVPDLWVRLTQTWPSDEVHLADLPLEHEMSQGPSTFARARTDAAGRFVMHTGLLARAALLRDRVPLGGDPRLRFLSESSEWFLEPPYGLFEHPRQDVELVARPTVVLTGNVTSAADGAPVPAFEGHARWAGHTHYVAFSGQAGVLDLCWPRWWGADEESRIDLAVEAKGYVPVEVPAYYARAERRATVDVRLTAVRPEEKAVLELEVVDWKGRPFDGPWWVKLVDPADDSKTLQDLGVLERKEAGVYTAAAPPGRWTMLLKPADSLGFLRWTRTVEVRPGVNRIRCEMPRHGTLVVRWPDGASPRAIAVTPTRGREGSGVTTQGGEFRSTTCAEGDYDVTTYGGDFHATGAGTVHAGEETVVELKE